MKSFRKTAVALTALAGLLFLFLTIQASRELHQQILFSTAPICKEHSTGPCIVRERVSLETRSGREGETTDTGCRIVINNGGRHFEVLLAVKSCLIPGTGTLNSLSTNDHPTSLTIGRNTYSLNYSEFTMAGYAAGMWLCMIMLHAVIAQRLRWPYSLQPLVALSGVMLAAVIGFASARQPIFMVALGVFMATATVIELSMHRRRPTYA